MNSVRSIVEKKIFEILEASEATMIPLVRLENMLEDYISEHSLYFSTSEIQRTIQSLLDCWILDKLIDYLPEEEEIELGLPLGCPTWFIKKNSDEETDFYKKLAPNEQELVKILREQSDPKNLGKISVKEAHILLAERDFPTNRREILIDDIIDSCFSYNGDEQIAWYELVEEMRKTDSYKQFDEEMIQQAEERMIRDYRLDEESPITGPIYERIAELEFQSPTAEEIAAWKQILRMVRKLPIKKLQMVATLLENGLPSPDSLKSYIENIE